jgi:hypothetical protein
MSRARCSGRWLQLACLSSGISAHAARARPVSFQFCISSSPRASESKLFAICAGALGYWAPFYSIDRPVMGAWARNAPMRGRVPFSHGIPRRDAQRLGKPPFLCGRLMLIGHGCPRNARRGNIVPRYRYRPQDDRVDRYGPPVAPGDIDPGGPGPSGW